MNQVTPRTWRQRLLYTSAPAAEERSRLLLVANNVILHLHPAYVPAQALRFTYTWGLGGLSAALALTLGLTGLLLMFRYDARVDFAYASIQQIETQVAFGSLLRGLHHWSANLLVVTAFLHLLRVFFTASYKQGRTMNWLIGIALFLLVLASNFTGYLLPWDQLAYWAITVSANLLEYIPLVGNTFSRFLLGGPVVAQGSLSNFYAFHVVLLPTLAAMGMGYHFWKVRKNGGISQPLRKESERVERLSTIPNLVGRELAALAVLFTLLLVWAASLSAPLGQIADPFNSPNPAKAAWYFMGLQELLLHMHPLAALLLTAIILAGMILLPRWDSREEDIGIYFRSPAGRRAALIGALLAIDIVPLLVVLDEYWLDVPGLFSGLPVEITNGVVPLFLTLAFFVVIYLGMRLFVSYQGVKANHSEALLGLLVFLVAAIVTLTIIGNFFRGANMALALPF
ncbi:MAG: cytochrome b N-terminal domain-containing protein [Chloroflexi bacterium]|nr:cytochrome b N-terminal domain-containing protein [Chloroflexota bacterium]